MPSANVSSVSVDYFIHGNVAICFFWGQCYAQSTCYRKKPHALTFPEKTIARFFSRPIVQIVIWVAVLETLGSLSSLFSMPGPWYVQLSKSTLTPPSYVFPIAWTILYALLGFYGWSLWHYYSSPRVLKNVFVVQMLFNLSWSTIFLSFKMSLWLCCP